VVLVYKEFQHQVQLQEGRAMYKMVVGPELLPLEFQIYNGTIQAAILAAQLQKMPGLQQV
jgi:hypothetical protein